MDSTVKTGHVGPLGARLRARRYALGATQGSIARRVGIRQESYSAYELGQTRPAAAHVPALAEALGLDLDELAELVAEASAA
jgi:transcriptional regulator with XRE-family HTH domain